MAPLELGSELARESFPKLGGVFSDPPVCDRGISALRRLDSIGHLGISRILTQSLHAPLHAPLQRANSDPTGYPQRYQRTVKRSFGTRVSQGKS